MTDKATNIKTKLKLFINNIDELGSTFVTYRALLIKDLLQLTLNFVQDKEQECEELKKKKEENEKFYLTRYVNKESRCLELEDERNYYKQALDEIEELAKHNNFLVRDPFCGTGYRDLSGQILNIINKAKERK